ncbi:MAG: AhpC/TSA family protein [Marinilabiliaceae bacterium]|nr:AhpC/TSA family protein [Marinilabiliaceae bacterium]
MILVSCDGGTKYTINVKYPDNSLDGQYSYLYRFERGVRDVEVVDSALINGGIAVMEGECAATELCAIINQRERVFLILEPGVIDVEIEKGLASGSKLNDKWTNYQNELSNLGMKYNDIYQGKMQEAGENVQALHDSLLGEYVRESLAISHLVLADNKENSLGRAIFWLEIAQADLMDYNKYNAELNEAGRYISEYGPIQAITARYEAMASTREGMMFKDFTIEGGNLDGSDAKLSDYAGRGKYLLVDFWASWCGPCRRAMPLIQEAYKAFDKDKFEVLSIAVWDEHDETLKAIEAEGMTWKHIIDAGSIPTEMYGVNGIPHLMLIGPDGVILHRGIAPANIMKVIGERL